MRARGKRSSYAPTPPANPIPIASVERGRGKGRREEERGGRRSTWNPAPARRRRLPPRESGPSANRLSERDSVPSATPALSATDSHSVRRDPRAAPRPTLAPSPTASLLATARLAVTSSPPLSSAALRLSSCSPFFLCSSSPFFLCSSSASFPCSAPSCALLCFLCYARFPYLCVIV